MDLYEVQRAIQALGVVGLENIPVYTENGPVGTADLKYDGDGKPYILLSAE